MTNVNKDNQNSDDSSGSTSASGAGLPLRGLAMILIAVAVLLGLWGLYAMTREDSSDTGAVDQAATTTAVTRGQGAGATSTGNSAEPSPDGQTSREQQSETSRAPAEGDADRAASEPASAADSTRAPAPGAGADAAKAPADPARLNILNNSTVPNLAAEVASTLDTQGYDVGEVGNLADQILPENTVYFQPGNPDAETRARELADRVGGVAREYDASLPPETEGANDITLVLVNQVAL